MGTDNLFHRKKVKSVKYLARRKAKRRSYDKVLIVCEGEKTEPFYFKELRIHYDLASANIEVFGAKGTDPASIFGFARRRFAAEKKKGDSYDRVYCVFDKDKHQNFLTTVESIRIANPEGVYFAITSVPCFEFWLLLHFCYTTSPYHSVPGKSACDQVISDLERYLPGYEKGCRNLFSELFTQVEVAKKRATKVCVQAREAQTENPSTRVHELVEYLQNIKQK